MLAPTPVTDINARDAPVFIAGESYGGYRVGRLARVLQESTGIGLNGAILISPALELTPLSPNDYDVLGWVDRLPTMAAAAALAQAPVAAVVAGFLGGFGALYALDLFVYRGRVAGIHSEHRRAVDRYHRRHPPRGDEVTVLALGTSAQETIEGLSIGVAMAIDPRFGVFAIPFMFKGQEHANKVINDPDLNKEILALGRDKGLRGVSVFTYSPSHYFARTPIRTLDDFKGKKLRVNATPAERDRVVDGPLPDERRVAQLAQPQAHAVGGGRARARRGRRGD